MRPRLKPVEIADDVIEFAVEDAAQAQALASLLREFDQAEDVVAGLDRVAVRFDPADAGTLLKDLDAIELPEGDRNKPTTPIEIGIHYGGEDGPDIDRVCAELNLTPAALIAAHTEAIHRVEMIGFTPGFSYLSGLPEAFKISRLPDPRPRVPAGSVGISAAFTGIYALHGPGGWPIIGRTDAALFDAASRDPFLLTPGQSVRFRAL